MINTEHTDITNQRKNLKNLKKLANSREVKVSKTIILKAINSNSDEKTVYKLLQHVYI